MMLLLKGPVFPNVHGLPGPVIRKQMTRRGGAPFGFSTDPRWMADKGLGDVLWRIPFRRARQM